MSARRFMVSGFLVVVIALLITGGVWARGGETATSGISAGLSGTGFSYQGHLTRTGAAVSDSCDFLFGLFDSDEHGNQIGQSVGHGAVPIDKGLFAVILDFGAGAFDGSARYLETSLRCTGTGGDYTTLVPRQALTPAPYALALPGLYTLPNDTSPNVMGGFVGNEASTGVVGGTISGGGAENEINRVQQDFGTVGGGSGNTATGFASSIGGGSDNQADADYSTIAGGKEAYAGLFGQLAYASGSFAIRGDAQSSTYVLRNTTVDGTQTELFTDGVVSRIPVPEGSTIAFDALIVGRTSGGDSLVYSIFGAVENTGGTTRLVSRFHVMQSSDLSGMRASVEADDDNDAIKVLVNPVHDTTQVARWVATVRTSELSW